MLTGACLCGALRYEVDGPLEALAHCHCSMCRKHHGAPFASMASVSAGRFRWRSGDASVGEYASSSRRVRRFCQVCGSVAPVQMGDRVLMPAGNLQGELGDVHPVHVFAGSKAPWHTIADALPRYETLPNEAPSAAPAAALAEHRPAAASPDAAGGSCLCGAVAFSVNGAPARWFQCHCSRCRLGRSAAHGSNTFFAADQFAWQAGRELVRKYKLPEAERFTVSFCVRCGGGAPVERDNVPFVLVPAALFDGAVFDGAAGWRPQAHIHVASKASWYTIADGLPQFAELPPS